LKEKAAFCRVAFSFGVQSSGLQSNTNEQEG